MKAGLEDELKEVWKPDRIVVTCQRCEEVLYDTDRDHPHGPLPARCGGAVRTAAKIDIKTASHAETTGHHGYDIGVEPGDQVEEIDVEVTVNG